MATRELEKVRHIMFEATGLDLAYAYDDLAFAENGVFIVQFKENVTPQLDIYFNQECWEEEKQRMVKSLAKTGKQRGFTINMSGEFKMEANETNEEINIQFLKKKKDNP